MKGMSAAPAAKHGQATGVIKAIDAKAGTLTIQHGPIPGVGWPAMTMSFKAKPATLINGLKVGETIGFDTTVRGMDADVTAVTAPLIAADRAFAPNARRRRRSFRRLAHRPRGAGNARRDGK